VLGVGEWNDMNEIDIEMGSDDSNTASSRLTDRDREKEREKRAAAILNDGERITFLTIGLTAVSSIAIAILLLTTATLPTIRRPITPSLYINGITDVNGGLL
jgi:hypothetical protein